MEKKLYAVANWKMYKTAREAADYIEELLPLVEGSQVNIYLSVPYTSIAPAAGYAKKTNVVIGAQNMNDAREGAFTGEIAALMLKEAGAHFVLIGHSERRHIFHEDNAMIHKKVLRALQDELRPILCVGETKEEYEAKTTEEVLQKQLLSALKDVPKEEALELIVAYEPVWAIGTGKVPTAKEIQAVHSFIRSSLEELFGKKTAEKIPLLYGGSVKSSNTLEIVSEKDVDGVLIGGASLDPKHLSEIIQHIEKTLAPKKRSKTAAKTPAKKRVKKTGSRVKKEKKE